jgi:hypothetical protein
MEKKDNDQIEMWKSTDKKEQVKRFLQDDVEKFNKESNGMITTKVINDKKEIESDCCVCLEDYCPVVCSLDKCTHIFCMKCTIKMLTNDLKVTCPLCRIISEQAGIVLPLERSEKTRKLVSNSSTFEIKQIIEEEAFYSLIEREINWRNFLFLKNGNQEKLLFLEKKSPIFRKIFKNTNICLNSFDNDIKFSQTFIYLPECKLEQIQFDMKLSRLVQLGAEKIITSFKEQVKKYSKDQNLIANLSSIYFYHIIYLDSFVELEDGTIMNFIQYFFYSQEDHSKLFELAEKLKLSTYLRNTIEVMIEGQKDLRKVEFIWDEQHYYLIKGFKPQELEKYSKILYWIVKTTRKINDKEAQEELKKKVIGKKIPNKDLKTWRQFIYNFFLPKYQKNILYEKGFFIYT